MKYYVRGTVTISVQMEVEADSPEQAKELAEENWPGLEDYAGNGASYGKLIGTAQECLTLEAGDDQPEFGEVSQESQEG